MQEEHFVESSSHDEQFIGQAAHSPVGSSSSPKTGPKLELHIEHLEESSLQFKQLSGHEEQRPVETPSTMTSP